ncbi:hypothetical protein WDU94_001901 [Cyamophila willieti]
MGENGSADGEKQKEGLPDGELFILEAKLASLFSIIQGIYNTIGPAIVDRTKRGIFLAKAASLDLTLPKYEECLNKIQFLRQAKDPNYVVSFDDLEKVTDLHGQIKFHEKRFSSSKEPEQVASNTVAQPKLPPLELPSFNGTISDWPTFFETFKSLIHTNPSLSDDQKVQYLVSKLKDQALNVCAGVPPVGSNYEQIWKSLVERYQDTRYLASHYVDNILNFKNITSETHVSYTQFMDKLGSSVLALQALDIENLAEYLLYSIAIKKLDVNLAEKFETKVLEKDSMPTFTDLLQFVKDRVRVVERTKTHCVSFKCSAKY